MSEVQRWCPRCSKEQGQSVYHKLGNGCSDRIVYYPMLDLDQAIRKNGNKPLVPWKKVKKEL